MTTYYDNLEMEDRTPLIQRIRDFFSLWHRGKNTFLAWLQAGAFKPGDVYIMDGERHVVCNS